MLYIVDYCQFDILFMSYICWFDYFQIFWYVYCMRYMEGKIKYKYVWLWWKHKAPISGCEASQKKFTGPKKGRFPETDDAGFKFFQERRKTRLFVSYDLLREAAIKKGQIFEHSSKLFFNPLQSLTY
jgi:hypothetical protein